MEYSFTRCNCWLFWEFKIFWPLALLNAFVRQLFCGWRQLQSMPKHYFYICTKIIPKSNKYIFKCVQNVCLNFHSCSSEKRVIELVHKIGYKKAAKLKRDGSLCGFDIYGAVSCLRLAVFVFSRNGCNPCCQRTQRISDLICNCCSATASILLIHCFLSLLILQMLSPQPPLEITVFSSW